MIAVSREQPGARPACARSVPAVRRLPSTESALPVSDASYDSYVSYDVY